LARDRLTLAEWNDYSEQYTATRGQPLPSDDDRRHAGERKIWFSEAAIDFMNDIVKAITSAGASMPYLFRADQPNRKLIVALALMYTADHLD
jgi:hypothetical protein